MIRLFFSYSHLDEKYRNELEKHLMSLKHQGIIESWHDRCLVVGEEWEYRINEELRLADIVLLLISSDFIASRYCYELEMQEALARHENKEAVVIPVILRPCNWTNLPFGKLQSATKDGKPVEKYQSLDDAFLEITKSIEVVAKQLSASKNRSKAATSTFSVSTENTDKHQILGVGTELPRSSNLAIPKTFSDHDRDTFVNEAFTYIALFFENSLLELQKRNPDINTRYQGVDARSFEASIYRNGSLASKCGIWLGSNFGSRGTPSIMFSHSGLGQGNSFNDSMSVKDNGNLLYLEPFGFSHQYSGENNSLTNQGAAEYYWGMLFEPVKRQ